MRRGVEFFRLVFFGLLPDVLEADMSFEDGDTSPWPSRIRQVSRLSLLPTRLRECFHTQQHSTVANLAVQ